MTEQTFTDEDLKVLKEFLQTRIIKPGLDPTGEETIGFKFKMTALLARLEAAECNMGGHSAKCDESLYCICSKKDRDIAWRRSAGKAIRD